MIAADRADEDVALRPPIPDTYEIHEWHDKFGIIAGITGRRGGFDLRLPEGAGSPEPSGNWRAFLDAWSGRFATFVIGRQDHGTVVATTDDARPGWFVRDGVDGHLTGNAGVLLLVTVADCVPVYLAHPATGTLALLHGGWRGIASNILEHGIAELVGTAHTRVDELVMHCGISICGKCYEVHREVAARVSGHGASRLDLRAELIQRARALGIRSVSVSGRCSAHDPDRFFSHRRSGGMDGRMVAYLGVPSSP